MVDQVPEMEYNNLRNDVLDHLYGECVWDDEAKQWRPQNIVTPLQVNEAYWKQVLQDDYPAECALDRVSAKFFEGEPDPNRRNKPRLGIVLYFADGRWVRYHPIATLIWSDGQLPCDAMEKRYNLAAKLAKRAEKDRL